jgi:hypothetical protein
MSELPLVSTREAVSLNYTSTLSSLLGSNAICSGWGHRLGYLSTNRFSPRPNPSLIPVTLLLLPSPVLLSQTIESVATSNSLLAKGKMVERTESWLSRPKGKEVCHVELFSLWPRHSIDSLKDFFSAVR